MKKKKENSSHFFSCCCVSVTILRLLAVRFQIIALPSLDVWKRWFWLIISRRLELVHAAKKKCSSKFTRERLQTIDNRASEREWCKIYRLFHLRFKPADCLFCHQLAEWWERKNDVSTWSAPHNKNSISFFFLNSSRLKHIAKHFFSLSDSALVATTRRSIVWIFFSLKFIVPQKWVRKCLGLFGNSALFSAEKDESHGCESSSRIDKRKYEER